MAAELSAAIATHVPEDLCALALAFIAEPCADARDFDGREHSSLAVPACGVGAHAACVGCAARRPVCAVCDGEVCGVCAEEVACEECGEVMRVCGQCVGESFGCCGEEHTVCRDCIRDADTCGACDYKMCTNCRKAYACAACGTELLYCTGGSHPDETDAPRLRGKRVPLRRRGVRRLRGRSRMPALRRVAVQRVRGARGAPDSLRSVEASPIDPARLTVG